MIKKTLFTILFAIIAMTVQAQQIKMIEPTLSDYLPLLESKGYKAYSFDTEKLKGAVVEPVIMEYTKGEEPKNVLNFNITMSIDKKLVIGFIPSENDSTANFLFHYSNYGRFGSRLHLKPIYAPEKPDDKWYMYESRPFKLGDSFKKGDFIPLVLYGSYWYEPESGACRFCGENDIKPDLSSDIVKSIPHYFVLGIRIIRNS